MVLSCFRVQGVAESFLFFYTTYSPSYSFLSAGASLDALDSECSLRNPFALRELLNNLE